MAHDDRTTTAVSEPATPGPTVATHATADAAAPAGRRRPTRRTASAYAGLVVVLAVSLLAPSGTDASYGWWSLLPAVTLFAFVLTTHRVIEGFLWSGLLATVIIYRGSVATAWFDALFGQITDADNAGLLVRLAAIGGLIGVFERTGLATSFARAAGRLARGPRTAGIVTVVLTLLLSNDSYVSASGVTVSLAPVNRRFGLPRTFTASLVRTAGETANTLNPIGTTPVLVAGLLVAAGYGTDQLSTYLGVLPYLFHSMAAVVIALLLAARVLPVVGPLRADFRAAAADPAQAAAGTGRLPHALNFLAPVVVVIATSLTTGNIELGFLLGILLTGALLVVQGWTTIAGYVDTVIEGMKDIFPLILLMALAFVLVHGISTLNFTEFVVQHVDGAIAPQWLPLIIFAIFAVTEMLVTLNWSLYILMVPVLVQLCAQTGASVPATVAAVLSAGTLGISAAISSDVGLLTASSARIPLYRHWITNLPYQVAAAAVAAAGFVVVGLLGVTG
ncbi:Na+/H+ antiporter NhaC family protein [Kineococcus sp. SYSU DK002]|uniref:Na+/H+ antiporter NhaC family protein n=1 Tax=Kineococcus sp. SYSU DK002 TaxID=3383123 RepID=UPI003D7D9350